MKTRKICRISSLSVLLFLIIRIPVSAQDSTELLLDLKYYTKNNQVAYVNVFTKVKLEKKKFRGIPSIPVTVYLDSSDQGSIVGKVITDKNGQGRIYLSSSLKELWDMADAHSFLGTAEAVKPFAEATAELKITKARITIDTLTEDTIHYVNIKVEEMRDKVWTAVKDVELKAAIKRLGGDLNISDEATYTTDSLGAVSAEFKRDSLPGDTTGMLTLVAKVEDNETYGNLSVEKKVQWGKPFAYHTNFNEATLYATRDKTPGWLLLLAATIVTIVWGTLIYLILQVLKIRKLGRAVS